MQMSKRMHTIETRNEEIFVLRERGPPSTEGEQELDLWWYVIRKPVIQFANNATISNINILTDSQDNHEK